LERPRRKRGRFRFRAFTMTRALYPFLNDAAGSVARSFDA
jgi:hypothetical protein